MSHRRATLLSRAPEAVLAISPGRRLRRALVLWLMTLVVPGSAQLAVGRRWVGAVAVAVWVAVLAALVVLVVRARTDRAAAIDLVTASDTITALRVGLVVLAIGWAALLVDAWRLAMPGALGGPRTALLAVLNVAVIAGLAGSAAYAQQLLAVSNESIEQVFSESAPTSDPLEGRYNILLIGSDSGADRSGLRPDSLTVASIDTSTGRTVLVSLPRNLQNVPFPESSPMHAIYPYGYTCGSECLLNAVHTEAAERTDLYPNSDDPGLDATMEAVEGATGLKINYYLMVNLAGFRSLIDAVGGVELDVKTRIAKFGKDDAWKQQYIEPGVQKLDGEDTLWYARSRVQSDDYTRMGRQKCVMSAMLDQLDPQTVVLNSLDIARSGKNLLSGNMPRQELGQFADLALKSRNQKITSVSLVPPLVDVTNPDFEMIKATIATAIKESEGRSEAEATETAPTSTPTTQATPPTGEVVDPNTLPPDERDELLQRTANNNDDLKAAC